MPFSTLSLGMTIEIVLATLLIATIYYCYTINQKITSVIDLETKKAELDVQLEARILEAQRLEREIKYLLNDFDRAKRAQSVRTAPINYKKAS